MPEIKIKPSLTTIGKKRLSEGKFNITKATVVDDGINYKLIDTSFQDPNIQLERTRLFDVWKDASSIMKYKIPRSREDSRNIDDPVPLNFQRIGEDVNINVRKSDNVDKSGSIRQPAIINSDLKLLNYYGTSQRDFNEVIDLRVEVPYLNNPAITKPQYITFSLEDATHFDIALSDLNKRNYSEDTDFSEVVYDLEVKNDPMLNNANASITTFRKLQSHSAGFAVYISEARKRTQDQPVINRLYEIRSEMPNGEITNLGRVNLQQLQNEIEGARISGYRVILDDIIDAPSDEILTDRNHPESINLGLTRSQNTSKTVNVFCNQSEAQYNSIILRYRGNYDYGHIDNLYSTYLTVFSETTGHFEKIKLNIVPALPLNAT